MLKIPRSLQFPHKINVSELYSAVINVVYRNFYVYTSVYCLHIVIASDIYCWCINQCMNMRIHAVTCLSYGMCMPVVLELVVYHHRVSRSACADQSRQ